MAQVDLVKAIDEGRVTSTQIGIILVCWIINMLDGFDVLAIAYTAPAISDQWLLPADQLGVVLSAGLVGMAAEYSPAHRRNFAISFLQSGYPIVALLGGFIAAPSIPAFGWEIIFFIGGGATLVMVAIVLLFAGVAPLSDGATAGQCIA